MASPAQDHMVRPAPRTVTSLAYAFELNDLLASTYASIDQLEGKILNHEIGVDVSVGESRLLDVVGRKTLHTDHKLSVSQIAHALDIKKPSVTATVARLVEKGFLTKSRSETDGRRVDVSLTREGARVYRLHAIFHKHLADSIMNEMSEEERKVLLVGVRRLERFYADAVREA